MRNGNKNGNPLSFPKPNATKGTIYYKKGTYDSWKKTAKWNRIFVEAFKDDVFYADRAGKKKLIEPKKENYKYGIKATGLGSSFWMVLPTNTPIGFTYKDDAEKILQKLKPKILEKGNQTWWSQATAKTSTLPQTADTGKKGRLEKVFWPDLNKLNTLEEYLQESLSIPPKRRAEIKKLKTLITEEKRMSTSEFDRLTRSFMDSRKWLKKTGGSSSDYHHMAIKITAPNREPIYIDAQGYDYARYVGFPYSTMDLLWQLEKDAKKSKSSKAKAKPKTAQAVASKGLTAAKKKEIKAKAKAKAKELTSLRRLKTRSGTLTTQTQLTKLIENHLINWEHRKRDGHTTAFRPVVRLFNPSGRGTFYLSEFDPDEGSFFGFGGYQKGTGELGYSLLEDFKKQLPPFGLPFERDRHWTPGKETVVEMAQKESYSNSYI
jgi:hypothetical protein